MRPIKIKITGINSFNKTQEINFDSLTKDGLFGIFGDTGTGKSSIIDCITLALYGKIVRYNGTSDKGDFLNINCEEGAVEFVFSVRDNKGEQIYRIKRSFQRKGEKINNGVINLSMLNVNTKEYDVKTVKQLETNSVIQEIIGLSYEDFTRAVVLPQGKFSEFLLLKGVDKRNMLERIFSLEEYGKILQGKISEEKKDNKKILDELKGNLQGKIPKEYIDIKLSDEELEKKIELSIENNKKELENNKKLSEDLRKNIDKNIKDNNLLNELMRFKEKYDEYRIKIEELVRYEYKYLDFRNKLEQAEEVDDIWVKIREKEDLSKQVKEMAIVVKEKEEESFKSGKELEIVGKKFGEYKNKKEIDNPKLEKEVLELDNIKNILIRKMELEKEISVDREELVNIEGQEANIDKDLEMLVKEKEELDKLNEELEAFNLGESLNNDELAVKISMEINKINNNDIKLDDSDLDDDDIKLDNVKKLGIDVLIGYKNDLIKNIEGLKQNIEILEKENVNINNELSDLNAQSNINQNKEVIQKLASTLRDNSPCPLCGSKEHPNILTPDDILGSITESINIEIEINNNKLKKNEEDIGGIKRKIEINNDRVKELEEGILKGIVEDLGGVAREEVESRCIDARVMFLKLGNRIRNNKDKINNNIQRLRWLEDKINNFKNIKSKNIEKKGGLKGGLEYRIKELESIIGGLEDNKKGLKLEEIILEIKNINEIISKNIKDYEESEDILKKLENNNNKIVLRLKEVTVGYDKDRSRLEILEEYIIKQINSREVLKGKTEDEVKEYYADKDKQEYYKNKIKSYEDKYSEYKGQLNMLDDEAVKISNDSEIEVEKIKDVRDIDDIKDSIKILKELADKMQDDSSNRLIRKGELENIIKLQEELLDEIIELHKKIKKEQADYDILDELSNVMKGGAFVEYLAKSQLETIVKDASRRLLDMTQNKYDIMIKNDDFVVKDCLNGGEIRSVRSLSGGEIFMASLCLALALSSRIQLNNKSPLEVFFLDEGFGTLDNNVLDTVMSSLEELQNDNLNVGIITHVEEIKNRVSNKIVIKGSEEGSIINIE